MIAEKGPHRAIAAARAAGVPLVLAGVIQLGQQAFFDREVAPHIDGDRVRFVGEVTGIVKRSLFAGARALLRPIRWEEPFGMVIIEALACGTPVIAFPEGAARELVVDGKTGFLVANESAMSAAVDRLPRIVARDCRTWFAEHCHVDVVAAAYEQTYRSVLRRVGVASFGSRLMRLTLLSMPARLPPRLSPRRAGRQRTRSSLLRRRHPRSSALTAPDRRAGAAPAQPAVVGVEDML
jgi:hypothetical protein